MQNIFWDCIIQGIGKQPSSRWDVLKKIFKKFKEHPESVGENYFQHFAFAFHISLIAAKISLIAFIHAALPFLFLNDASNELEKLMQTIKNRRKKP